MTTYVLGGGCFWCLNAVYRRLKGVSSVVSGYAGGHVKNPTYDDVSSGQTGHAEVIQVTFDEAGIPAKTILDIFFSIHDPTTLNRQGADTGTQYRSIMLYADVIQQTAFLEARDRSKRLWDNPIVTEIVPLTAFYPAENEHQDYFSEHPEAGYCTIVIHPKLVEARQAFKAWFKEEES